MAKNKKSTTPLMQQYDAIKAKHPTALLLFRVGDFYETFGSDAEKTAKILGIVLTARNNGGDQTPLAGFPHHALNTYLYKLVKAGERVAICDQLEDASQTKGIVKRGITEIITPGVTYESELLDSKTNNFLAAIYKGEKNYALALADVSTGEFSVAEGSESYILKLLAQFNPSEILISKPQRNQLQESLQGKPLFTLESWIFSESFANEKLLSHFKTHNLTGFGLDNKVDSIISAGAILHYLGETRNDKLGHIQTIRRISPEGTLWLDHFSIRNLELFHPLQSGGTALIDIIDHTQTAMGGRLLKRWIGLPLTHREHIEKRHQKVSKLQKENLFESVRTTLSKCIDIERVVARIAAARVHPKELKALSSSLHKVLELSTLLQSNSYHSSIDDHTVSAITELLDSRLEENPPVLVSKGGVIRTGVSEELDELRSLSEKGHDHLNALLEREIERTGITSLKIASNNVFGYYIEVRNTHKDKVPEEWIRKQTLVNAERYITEELKEYESKISSAEARIQILEQELYSQLVEDLQPNISSLQQLSNEIASIDCLSNFAYIAKAYNYHRPKLNDSFTLSIKEARHPVIEQRLPHDQSYIANDILLDDQKQQIMMITGPNMSGKSAILRQTALCVILAQSGSFIPASDAEMGITDKLFTRVGASDNLSKGESTFMVEMNETAAIINNLSPRSLVLMDEIGRGTSTYDGISIAWAIATYLHESKDRPKTLFATHYHELNQMTDSYSRVKNYHVAVKESKDHVLFLRKLLPGGSEHSFGIHVAKMAGMPATLLQQAQKVLKNLEKSGDRQEKQANLTSNSGEMQLSFIQLDDPVLLEIKEELMDIDVNSLTPVEALVTLESIKKRLGKL